jgi:hypothetical protein
VRTSQITMPYKKQSPFHFVLQQHVEQRRSCFYRMMEICVQKWTFDPTHCMHTMFAMLIYVHQYYKIARHRHVQVYSKPVPTSLLQSIRQTKRHSQVFAFQFGFRKHSWWRTWLIYNKLINWFGGCKFDGHGFVIWKYKQRWFLIQSWHGEYEVTHPKAGMRELFKQDIETMNRFMNKWQCDMKTNNYVTWTQEDETFVNAWGNHDKSFLQLDQNYELFMQHLVSYPISH